MWFIPFSKSRLLLIKINEIEKSQREFDVHLHKIGLQCVTMWDHGLFSSFYFFGYCRKAKTSCTFYSFMYYVVSYLWCCKSLKAIIPNFNCRFCYSKILMSFTTIKAAPACRCNLLYSIKSSKLLIGNLPGRFLFSSWFHQS